MKFTNASGLPAAWTMGFEPDGRELLVVVAKATYALPADGEPATLAAAQRELVQADRFTGEPGASAPLHETDYAHRKLGCDVLLLGRAHAPHGRPVTRLPVGVRVGAWVKRLAVLGERVWCKRLGGSVAASAPRRFVSQPIGYDHAFGGTDRTREARGEVHGYLANPAGRGWWRYRDRIDGQPLPHTEALDEPVTDPHGSYRPMAFSPIGRNWAPRLGYVGTYDDAWIQNRAPLWPADFDPRYFQSAPPDQVLPYLQGGEPVALANLTPDGLRRFELPRRAMPVVFIPHRGPDIAVQANLDTLVLEPDAGCFTLAWRACLPMARSVFDLQETIVGEMSPAWHRARRFPGKTYYPGLDALVAARRARRATP